ncbi:hypothetical protein HMPREF9078_02313 [Capnocytophaga sp. oral taxon 380 str. F0488]|nr:hypothetical protein HMPREF9078_02313 [Capnocytophaga sp. oral taxon 380 str. F0488]
MRGNVANHLLGKPPNPRRGTSWKKVTNFPLYTYTAVAGYLQRRNVATKGKLSGGSRGSKEENQRQRELY